MSQELEMFGASKWCEGLWQAVNEAQSVWGVCVSLLKKTVQSRFLNSW